MEIVGVDVIRSLNPFLTTDNVLAAAWTTDDGHADPSGFCNALAKAARDLGATVQRHNRVLDILAAPRGEWEVITEKGTILAEMVVNAAGCYARRGGEDGGRRCADHQHAAPLYRHPSHSKPSASAARRSR